MKLALLLLAVSCAAQTPLSNCMQVRALDGCNIETICDGVSVSTTLAYCGQNRISHYFGISARPRPQDLMPLPEAMPPSVIIGQLQIHQGYFVPSDVPAIQEKYLAHHAGDSCNDQVPSGTACMYAADDYDVRWTCADKSRILLTAEDGSRHCVKF